MVHCPLSPRASLPVSTSGGANCGGNGTVNVSIGAGELWSQVTSWPTVLAATVDAPLLWSILRSPPTE